VLPLSLPALVLAGFVVSLVTVVVPGPVSLVASRITMSRGILAAWWFLLGAVAVDVVLFVALAAGMAPLLRTIGALPIVRADRRPGAVLRRDHLHAATQSGAAH